MVHGETTTRSPFNADAVIARLRARGVEQLRGASGISVILDGSDLRKPHAREREGLQRVKRLAGGDTVPGYRTLNAIGIGHERRGLLYHHLFSSTAADFLSESAETQTALTTIGTTLAPLAAEVTGILDAGFDAIAVWDAVWMQGVHIVCRVRDRTRLVHPSATTPACHLHDCAPDSRPLAQVETELVVRKREGATAGEVTIRQRGRGSDAGRAALPTRGADGGTGRMARTGGCPLGGMAGGSPPRSRHERSLVAGDGLAGNDSGGSDGDIPHVPATLGDRGCVHGGQAVPWLGRRAGARFRRGAPIGGLGLGGGGQLYELGVRLE